MTKVSVMRPDDRVRTGLAWMTALSIVTWILVDRGLIHQSLEWFMFAYTMLTLATLSLMQLRRQYRQGKAPFRPFIWGLAFLGMGSLSVTSHYLIHQWINTEVVDPLFQQVAAEYGITYYSGRTDDQAGRVAGILPGTDVQITLEVLEDDTRRFTTAITVSPPQSDAGVLLPLGWESATMGRRQLLRFPQKVSDPASAEGLRQLFESLHITAHTSQDPT